MRISEIYRCNPRVFSFEFFPPKTDEGFRTLFRTIEKLKSRQPDFVSMTWGAGGSTRRKTVEIVVKIQREIGVTSMAHLSCIGSTPDEIGETLKRLEAGGIENVLALGGDRPDDYVAPEGAFTFANELANFIKERSDLCIGGACYPETHPLAASSEADLRHCKQKVDAGVEVLITQLFFDNADYFAFVERARAAGIAAPIVPGIMPILNVASVRRMTTLSGARIPDDLQLALDGVMGDDAATGNVGVQWATEQCRELLEQGVPGIHFYTLNKSGATRAIFEELLRG